MTVRESLVARHCAQRSIASRNDVVDAHRHLCERGARKFARRTSDRADLLQVAAIGLIKAAEYYRPDMRTPFDGYAWIMIVGELMHYVRDHERPIRVPRRLLTLEKAYAATWERAALELGTTPGPRQVAARLGVSLAAADEIRALRRNVAEPFPGEDDRPRLADALPAPEAPLPLEDRLTLAWALEELAERERAIVLGTYGGGLTQTELAVRLGLSQSHVSKLLARALRNLGRRVA